MKKLLFITVGIVLLIFAALIILPFLFKDKIIQLVKETANEQIVAKVDFNNDITLSIFTNFPDFTVGVKDLSVVGVNEFEGDTLLALKEFSATLDLMSVIKGGQIKIKGILLDEPRIHALVKADGKANWDIAKPSEDSTEKDVADTTETQFNIALKKLEIRKAYIVYDDKQGNMSAELNNFNHTLTGDFSQDIFLLQTLTSTGALTFSFGGISYLHKVALSIKADIDANMKEMKFAFKENEINLNDLAFAFDGWVQMAEDYINMDIKYAAKKSEFKNFLSLVPAVYAKDFNSIKSSGKLGFDGFVKGTYNEKRLPAFAFNLLVENGMFKYPELPVPVNNVQVKLTVDNPDGNLDNTKIDLSQFHFEVSGDAFDAKLVATNVMKDPNIDAAFKGNLNLDNVTKIVPLDDGMKISGLISLDITAKGTVSTIEKEQYEDFNATGNLTVNKFIYASKDLPKPFYLNTTSLTFNPKTVTLNNFDAKIGNSDMQMTGELSNFFAYAFGKGTIKGVLNFNANLIDANEFLGEETASAQQPEETDTATLTAPEIPANIEFTLNSNINKLLYTNMEIIHFVGQVKVANQKLSFNKVGLNTLGSAIKMDGYYETTNPEKPTMVMDFGISNLDIQKAFITFNTVQKIAPIAEKTTGSFSTKFKMNTVLDKQLNPVYEQLFAEGTLDIPNAKIKGVKLFDKAAELLKYDNLKTPALNNVHIKFKVEKGRVYTQPFDVNIAGQKLNLAGSTGLDQTIDYIGKVAIPRAALGTANNAVNSLLNQANAKAGTSVKLSDLINVNLKVGGTFTDPNISTNLADIAKNEANSLKDQLVAEADKKRKELEAKAKAEAERYQKDIETKAKSEAERLKKEAEEKLKAEEEKAKKKAEEEAKKKLKGIFGK